MNAMKRLTQAMKSAVKRRILLSTGKVRHLKRGVSVGTAWYGNAYGGFYACPDYLGTGSVVYSIGIGEDISFDEAILERHGCKVFGFDPTPKSIDWVKGRGSTLPAGFTFIARGIGDKTGTADFFLPQKTEHVSGSFILQKNVDDKQKITVPLQSFGDMARELGHTRVDVLKMDVEGAEYQVIDSILDSQVFIGQILIEFHDRFFSDGRARTIAAIGKLKTRGFEICGVGDSFEEVSFINRKLIE